MQIVSISEPQEDKKTDELALGIDFGTTNSLIAISENYKTEIMKMEDGTDLVPSIVGSDSTQFIVGSMAKSCQSKIRSIKRLIAKSYPEIMASPYLLASQLDIRDDMGTPKINILNAYRSITEIAAEILRYLKNQAQIVLNREFTQVVISVPAYFDDAARGQVIFAAQLAGLDVIRLISEPTAAAYAYGLSKKVTGTYLVYDLGGGTFDVSILNMQRGIFQVVSTGGNNMLGGDDIDYAIARYISSQMDVGLSEMLIQKAKKIKEDFSQTYNSIVITIDNKRIHMSYREYEEIISPLVDKTINIASDVLGQESIDGIIMVGGSTRIKQIKTKLSNKFGVKIYNDIDPDKIVAFGAAMQAENLTKKSNALLIDVVPLSLGIELCGGIVEKLIMRNTPIPFSTTKEFTTHTDNQTGMKFHVLQGEREMASDCRSLANFELTGIRPKKAGKARITVKFGIDADNVLSVSAVDTDTGRAHNIDIKTTYGIDKKDISDALELAYNNVESDHISRILAESKDNAIRLVQDIKTALAESPEILSKVEYNAISESINSLQKVIKLDNRDIILLETDKLNKLASSFIQKYLDKGAELFLKNKYIDTLDQ